MSVYQLLQQSCIYKTVEAHVSLLSGSSTRRDQAAGVAMTPVTGRRADEPLRRSWPSGSQAHPEPSPSEAGKMVDNHSLGRLWAQSDLVVDAP